MMDQVKDFLVLHDEAKGGVLPADCMPFQTKHWSRTTQSEAGYWHWLIQWYGFLCCHLSVGAYNDSNFLMIVLLVLTLTITYVT